MHRTKLGKRKCRQLREEAKLDELLRMAQMKLDATLYRIEELERSAKRQLDNRLQLLVARTHRNVLQMKWCDFLKLGVSHFDDYRMIMPPPPPVPAANPPPAANTRSHSVGPRSGRTRTPRPLIGAAQRAQVQSVDRAKVPSQCEPPVVTVMRWPKPGELALSICGSPLAVQSFPDHCANVHIPTKVGVLKLQPKKLAEVKREVLQQLDASTLNQIKTLNSNLNLIVDMATKLGKLK